ncbi:MAG: hypothetical protein D6730_03670, partial [Bacteroidetes bacterium]
KESLYGQEDFAQPFNRVAYIYGFIPFLIVFVGIWKAGVISTSMIWGVVISVLLYFTILGGTTFMPNIRLARAHALKAISDAKHRQPKSMPGFLPLFRHQTQRTFFILLGLVAIAVLFFTLPASWRLAQLLRPMAILCLGIWFFTFAGMFFLLADEHHNVLNRFGIGRERRFLMFFRMPKFLNWIPAVPMSIFMIIWLLALSIPFSSMRNNNHIQKLELSPVAFEPGTDEKGRMEMEHYFKSWVKDRADSSVQGEIPLYLVAAQGGGIRSMAWTSHVLMEVQQDIPGFYPHVFAISGISGGSLGTAFFQAYYRDSLQGWQARHPLSPTGVELAVARHDSTSLPVYRPAFNEMIGEDYLSTITASLFFPEMIQLVTPWSIQAFDRSTRQERDWAAFYEEKTGYPTFSQGFLAFWKNTDSSYNHLAYPALLMNTTTVGSGQNAIISNLVLDPVFFKDDIDVYAHLEGDMPFITAASLSSRFPYLASSGTVVLEEKGGERKQINLADGGFVETTGLVTTLKMARAIQAYKTQLCQGPDSVLFKRVKPIILFISNGHTDLRNITSEDVKGLDFHSPLSAFFNALQREYVDEVARIGHSSRLPGEGFEFKVISMDRDQACNTGNGHVEVPLGWYLSGMAISEVECQARSLVADDGPQGLLPLVEKNREVIQFIRYLHRPAGSQEVQAQLTP